jgi:aminoglycoside phosphotransferase (APT) family kinase protein
VHGDLLPGNLLATGGRLTAVIDWGCLTTGDPSCDLLPAWNLLTSRTRPAFREALGCDEATWSRGRGWTLAQAAIALPYYWTASPPMARQARRALTELLSR